MASNSAGTEMVNIPSKVPGRPDRLKPKVIDAYNKAMGGVDKADQLAVYYCFQRKSIKWWKKVFFWLLETAVVNSYILYKEATQKPMKHIVFRRSLIKSLISYSNPSERPRPGRRRSSDSIERLQQGRHYSAKGKRRDCVVCSNRSHGQRHLTVYYCKTCSDCPPLHPEECFQVYHTARHLKKRRDDIN